MVQLVKNLPAMWETWVPSLGWIDPLEKSIDCIVHGVAKSRTQLSFWASLVAQLVKKSTCNMGDLGLIPGLGRFPEEGKSYPLQYSGLENSKDCLVNGVTKSWTQLSNFHFH